mmetsp:Transcript_2184/g.14501  ORF Transcript_2184/g.14501 Transcript_2184/m.14501 type:complete len:261 (+) Transcript_2184:2604-3386(+)
MAARYPFLEVSSSGLETSGPLAKEWTRMSNPPKSSLILSATSETVHRSYLANLLLFLTSSGTSSMVSYPASNGYTAASSNSDPSGNFLDSSNLPRRKDVSKMFNAGTHVPTATFAPACAMALAMAHPKPWSSATPATKTRLPRRSMGKPPPACTATSLVRFVLAAPKAPLRIERCAILFAVTAMVRRCSFLWCVWICADGRCAWVDWFFLRPRMDWLSLSLLGDAMPRHIISQTHKHTSQTHGSCSAPFPPHADCIPSKK